ncbi:MAG: hypothetical protein LBS16_01575 [Prevotellaceae bacterium]|nr:hypothetical protein [Prevotellaceae bacterium]
MKKWIEIYRSLFLRVAQMVISIDEAWRTLASEQQKPRQFQKEFVLPFVALCAVLTFIGDLFDTHANRIVLGMVHALFCAISLLGGFWISRFICQKTTAHYYNIQLDDVQTDKIVGYSFAVVMALNGALSLFPGLFFLSFLVLYVIYMLWMAAATIVGMDEENRGKFLIINSLSIIGSQLVIQKLLDILIPNV